MNALTTADVTGLVAFRKRSSNRYVRDDNTVFHVMADPRSGLVTLCGVKSTDRLIDDEYVVPAPSEGNTCQRCQRLDERA